MKFKKINDNLYIIRLEVGEEIVAEVVSFCKDLDIDSAEINAIGAVGEAILKHYCVGDKEYSEKHYDEEMEIASLFGIVTSIGLHAHIVLSNNKMQTFGGHLEAARVSATCEIVLRRIPEKLNRRHDDFTGLKLLDI
jgi:predicted DNA-binding protein with PD1-like motif